MRPTPYVASLRVYEPISSFEPADQLRWGSLPIESYTGREEQLRALQRTILSEPPSQKADGAHIIDHDGKRFVPPGPHQDVVGRSRRVQKLITQQCYSIFHN